MINHITITDLRTESIVENYNKYDNEMEGAINYLKIAYSAPYFYVLINNKPLVF